MHKQHVVSSQTHCRYDTFGFEWHLLTYMQLPAVEHADAVTVPWCLQPCFCTCIPHTSRSVYRLQHQCRNLEADSLETTTPSKKARSGIPQATNTLLLSPDMAHTAVPASVSCVQITLACRYWWTGHVMLSRSCCLTQCQILLHQPMTARC